MTWLAKRAGWGQGSPGAHNFRGVISRGNKKGGGPSEDFLAQVDSDIYELIQPLSQTSSCSARLSTARLTAPIHGFSIPILIFPTHLSMGQHL